VPYVKTTCERRELTFKTRSSWQRLVTNVRHPANAIATTGRSVVQDSPQRLWSLNTLQPRHEIPQKCFHDVGKVRYYKAIFNFMRQEMDMLSVSINGHVVHIYN